MAPHKIIIDTDPGIDDAMAISFAFAHPDIEVVGLTSIFGNVPLATATTNALRLREVCGTQTPVAEGETEPVGSHLPCPFWVHGKDGMGNIGLPPPSSEPEDEGAVDFIARMIEAHPGEITLVPIGPLTNIARLAQRYPDTVAKVREVVLMGGAAHVIGNVTPLAEFNIAGDAEAAEIVFAADWPVVMVGLDVTGNTVLTAEHFEAIVAANPSMDFLGRAAANYIDFYTRHVGLAGCCMHDVCAVAHVVEPDILTLTDARIMVDCTGISRGKTVVMPDMMEKSLQDWIDKPDWRGEQFPEGLKTWMRRPRHAYAAGIDQRRMTELFVETLKSGG